MKKIHLNLLWISSFTLLFFTSYGQLDPNRLTEFPTPEHLFKIEVFFPGEKPTKPNIKIQILEASDNNGATYGTLMRRLQAQAQKAGADAIVIMERQRQEGFDPEYGIYLAQNYLSAIGIKYIENIDYLDQYKKSESIYQYDETKGIYENVGYLHFELNSKIDSTTGSTTLRKHIEQYSTWHLAYENNKSWYTYLNNKNQAIRNYNKGEKKVYRVVKNQKISQIGLKLKGEKEWRTIDITYTERGEELERVMKWTDGLERERYFYNHKHQLWKIEVSRKEAGKEEVPYFKIEYEYYKNEDKDKLIEQYRF